MPSVDIWEGFYEPKVLLRQLKVDKRKNTFVGVGLECGTFLLTASRMAPLLVLTYIGTWWSHACRKKGGTVKVLLNYAH